MTTVPSPSPISPGALLRQPVASRFVLERQLWGFGGLHGGLALALMTSAMQEQAPGTRLQSVTGRFHRAISDEFQIEVSPVRSGRVLTTLAARAVTDKGLHVDASAIFCAPRRPVGPPVAPQAPVAPPPEECDVFTIPPEFVPISAHMQIRPVGPNRPYAGGTDPELTAWVRLLEDDDPPDDRRFILMMDALAPSYAAILSKLQLIPTVELTVRPSGELTAAPSPWILLRARTRTASAGGWVDEEIHAWGRNGEYLGSALQLRLVRHD